MGLVSADENDDLLDVRSWHQHPEPVFVPEPTGPRRVRAGHNSFFLSPDGTEDWLRLPRQDDGPVHLRKSDWTRAARLTWRDGIPHFGVPAAADDGHPPTPGLRTLPATSWAGSPGRAPVGGAPAEQDTKADDTEGQNELGRRLR